MVAGAGTVLDHHRLAERILQIVGNLPRKRVGGAAGHEGHDEITGIDLLHRVRDSNVDIPVIVITGHGDVSLAVEAMKVGAVDFLEKPFDDELLLSSVRSALRKGAHKARHNAEVSEINDRLAALSNRERQVLDGLVAGKANKVIAFDLGISPRTVEIYRANVMTKMSLYSLSDRIGWP